MSKSGVFAHRTSGGDGHHRGADRAAPAGAGPRPRAGADGAVSVQPPPAWPHAPDVSERQPGLAVSVLGSSGDGRDDPTLGLGGPAARAVADEIVQDSVGAAAAEI